MRVFAALELADDVRADIASIAGYIRESDQAWAGEKWVAPRNLHLTLAFAGDLDEARAQRLVDLLGQVLASADPEDVGLTSLVAVPSEKHAAMIWAVPGRDTPKVAVIGGLVAGCVAEVGGDNDLRPFRAHLTLARARRPRKVALRTLEEAWKLRDGKASERFVSGATVTVFSSTLTPAGPHYDALARIPVGGA